MSNHGNHPSQEDIDSYWRSFQPPQADNYQNQGDVNPQQNNVHSLPARPNTPASMVASTKYPANYQLAVYGNQFAIEVKPSSTRGGFFTVMLEAAKKTTGTKSFAWGDKISIQLTRTELLDFMAVLLCHKKSCEYSAHGSNNDKGFKLVFQPERNSFYLSLTAPKQNHGVEVPYLEGMQIGHLCLSLYVDNFPGLTTDSVLSGLNRMAHMYNNNHTQR